MLLLKVLYNELLQLTESFERDKRMTVYPLLGRPWGMIIIISLYLLLVLRWGPRFMANRKPYKVEGVMKVYNVLQILLNLVIFYESLKYSYWRSDFSRTCEPYNPDDTRPLTIKLARPALLYYYSKYFDMFDTVFFLLRKKYNQISFLHVYHHSLMAFGVYCYCTFLFASHFTITGVVNSFIHVVMYIYYQTAVMKPKMNLRPWKRIMTRLQLLQFSYFVIHYTLPLFNNYCNIPLGWVALSIIQNVVIIALFANFYYKEYIVKDRKQKLEKLTNT